MRGMESNHRGLRRRIMSPVSYQLLTTPQQDGTANEIRTRVLAVKGQCPRPLDDSCTNAIKTYYSAQVTFPAIGTF